MLNCDPLTLRESNKHKMKESQERAITFNQNPDKVSDFFC